MGLEQSFLGRLPSAVLPDTNQKRQNTEGQTQSSVLTIQKLVVTCTIIPVSTLSFCHTNTLTSGKQILNIILRVFIARYHAMHADRDIVRQIRLSVCPSVCPMPVLCLNE